LYFTGVYIINKNVKVIKSENILCEEIFPQKGKHTICGPGNPISLSASIELVAIELCHKKKTNYEKR